MPLEGRTVPSGTTTVDPTPVTVPVVAPMPQAPFPQIGDRVWKDLNGNGLQDPGEPAIAGVTLQLYQGTRLVGTTVTDGQGMYAFNRWDVTNGTADTSDDGLVAGTVYQIRVAGNQPILAGLRPTTANAGADDFRDSDAAGGVLQFTMGADELYSNYDFGYTAAASIGSLVWADTNNNGVKDANEAGLSGVTVRLLDVTGTTEVARTTTLTDGSYSFGSLVPGTYIVEISKTNFSAGGALVSYTSSTGLNGKAVGPYEGAKTLDPNGGKRGEYDHGTTVNGAVQSKPVILLGTTLNNQSVDFGFFSPGGLVGRVYVDVNSNGRIDAEDTAGVAGVRVTAAGPAGVFSTSTDASGNYAFTNLPVGTYTLTERQPAGYKGSTPVLTSATVAPGAPKSVNFGEARTTDLAVKVSSSASSVVIGGALTLTYRVKNLGTLDATGVTLTTALPPGLKIMSVSQTLGTYDRIQQRASIATLAAGSEVVVTIHVRAAQVGSYRLTGLVEGSGSEDQVKNNRSSLVVSVTAITPPPAAKPLSAMLLSMFWR
jgi:uncharacterized repeat protein (TIGR01451 family)